MKVALLEIAADRPACVNKDFMGGYGWAFHIGQSLRARLIQKVKKKGEKVPLLSFGYLAAIFRDHGHEVQVLSNTIPDVDLILINSSMIDYRNEIAWAKRIRAERPNARVGFIGPFAAYRSDLFLEHSDFVVSGEVEAAGYRLAKGEKLEGLVVSEPIQNLESLPFPAWEYFPLHEYSYFPALKEKPFAVVLSSRGCTYSCGYCPYPVNYKWRERSAEHVVDEIEYLVKKFGVKAFLFRDPLFSLNRTRCQKIAEGIIARKLNVKWACETRLDLLSKELIDTFYRSGLRVINVGVESADEEVLKKVSRIPIPVERQERIIGYCDSLGIRVTAFYVLGLTDDNSEKIRKTVGYAKHLNTHAAMFYLATPFPGTEYFRSVQSELKDHDYQEMDCFTPVLPPKELTSLQLKTLLEWAYVSYYYRPRWFFALLRRIWRDFFPASLPSAPALAGAPKS